MCLCMDIHESSDGLTLLTGQAMTGLFPVNTTLLLFWQLHGVNHGDFAVHWAMPGFVESDWSRKFPVSAQDGIVVLGKAHYMLHPISQQSPQDFPKSSARVGLVKHGSFPTLEGGMSAASFLHSSFLQANNAVMLWPFHVQKVLQASTHLCPAKLQPRCDVY